ncbi:MAG: MFS transporter [Candidatus Cyclobacteriaceae bacterium M3_2C_046]
MQQLLEKDSKANFKAFLWHAVFLALATNFMDVDTIIPAMVLKAGGNAIHLGLLTAIMLGGSKIFQLLFASFISNNSRKKGFLLGGINLRVVSLLGIAFLFFNLDQVDQGWTLIFIFFWITLFSVSGAFATVSYADLLGKSIFKDKRKRFFTLQQAIVSVGILLSAFLVREMLKWLEYPINYGTLFLIAGTLLFLASFGFWAIREIPSRINQKRNFLQFMKLIPSEIKQNANLKYYLIIINSLGLGLTILPFFIMQAKQNYQLTDELIGNFLVFRISGMVATSLLMYWFSRRREYKSVLTISLSIMAILPVLSLILIDYVLIYQTLFILAGVFVSTYKISINGVLIEISNEENRAMYSGIAGAGNILTTIFPLVAGFLIASVGFTAVFITVSILIASSLFFVRKLDCTTAEADDELMKNNS